MSTLTQISTKLICQAAGIDGIPRRFPAQIMINFHSETLELDKVFKFKQSFGLDYGDHGILKGVAATPMGRIWRISVLFCCCTAIVVLFCGSGVWVSLSLMTVAPQPNLNLETLALGTLNPDSGDYAKEGLLLERPSMARRELPLGERYLWYPPHSGFSNQARQLTNAFKIAFLLNRTLVLPPMLEHFELEQGTCLQPLHNSSELRKVSWAAIASRFSSPPSLRYIPMADILDLRSIKPLAKTIDLRVFLALWCGVDISSTCSGPICHTLARKYRLQPPLSIEGCTAKLFPTPHHRRTMRSTSNDVHEVDGDSTTTVWTHGEEASEASFLERLMASELQNDSHLSADIIARPLSIQRKDVIQTLGPASPAGDSFLLMLGTLYSRHYRDVKIVDPQEGTVNKTLNLLVDIKAPPGEPEMAAKLQAIALRPFSKHIMDAARHFMQERIKEQFLCTHVRLEDGAFLDKETQEAQVFAPLHQRLAELMVNSSRKDHYNTMNRRKTGTINIFVMTDRPPERWEGTHLQELNVNPMYKIHTMFGEEDLIINVTQKMRLSEQGLVHSFLPDPQLSWPATNDSELERYLSSSSPDTTTNISSLMQVSSDISLFIEEVVCSCATLGFQGTRASSLSANIRQLRDANMCPFGSSSQPLEV